MDLKEKLVSSFLAFENRVDIDSYVHDVRSEAIKVFEEKGFPSKKEEAWKYTSLNKILNGFSESRLRHQAQLWVVFIRDVIDKERKIGILNSKNVSLERTFEQKNINITIFQKKIETGKNANLIISLEKTVDEQKKEITQLLEQIEKLKRVDLGIEEKKQKILQQHEIIEEKSNGENSGS